MFVKGDLVKIEKPNSKTLRGIILSPSKKTCHVGETIDVLDELGLVRAIPREYIFLIRKF